MRSRYASPQVTLARALANAMLAGLPISRAAADRCAEVLGERPAWLSAVVRAVLRRHPDWHPNIGEAVVATIVNLAAFQRAFAAAAPPRVRHYILNAPRMSAPAWFEPLAMPNVPTCGDLAAWLGISASELEGFADLRGLQRNTDAERRSHYVRSFVPKASGGWRLIESPKPRLREIQRRLLDEVLARVPLHAAAHGFRERHSCRTHAQSHVGQAVVIRMDLCDFFLHVSRARVAGLFRSFGFPPGVAAMLASLATTRTPNRTFDRQPHDDADGDGTSERQRDWQQHQRYRVPHLPQGAPSSPALANLCAFALDVRLAALAQAAGARYTRYADDLVFSGGRDFARGADRFVAQVGAIAFEEGFSTNARKTRVMPQARRQQITGIVVNRRVNVPRVQFDRLKATLTNCLRSGPGSQNREGFADYRAHLAGRIAYVASLNAQRGARLRRLFDAIRW
jgi:hypothetical protein